MDPLVDVRRLLDAEVTRPAGDEAGVGRLDLQGLHSLPQPRQAVRDVEGVGHEVVGCASGQLEARTKHGGRKLEDLRSAVPAELLGLLAARTLRLVRVETVGVVEDRVLDGDVNRHDLRLALRTRHRLGMSEELVLGQAFEGGGHLHESTQALTTDNAVLRPMDVESPGRQARYLNRAIPWSGGARDAEQRLTRL